jgi:hypothetical protein
LTIRTSAKILVSELHIRYRNKGMSIIFGAFFRDVRTTATEMPRYAAATGKTTARGKAEKSVRSPKQMIKRT